MMRSDSPESRSEPVWSMFAPGQARRIVIGLFVAAIVLRLAIIWSGGQGFAPDESRYNDSRRAAAMILAGHLREGLTMPLSTGEHPGFKFVGILPALLEAKFGQSDRLAALFFGSFSLVNIALIWLCARRLGYGADGQFWTLLFSVCSVPLLFYARHLFPYDLAMTFALAGLYLGLKAGSGLTRSFVVGLLCGATFVTYLAYWLLAGAVMLVHTLFQAGRWWRIGLRGLVVAVGFGSTLLALWLFEQWGTGELIANSRKLSGITWNADFGNGWWMQWRYLWVADGVRAVLLLAAAGLGAFWLLRERDHRTWRSPLVVGLTAVVALYLMMGVGSEVAHLILVTGRVSRVLVPFLCLLGGFAADRLLTGARKPVLAWSLAAVVVLSALGPFVRIATQRFPLDFRARGEALLRHRAPDTADSYHRFVNVDNFLYEAETLRLEPAATLMAAAHPYQFAPYLYEGFSPPERARRLAIDHRMRLVRMEVPLNSRIQGEPDGMLRLKVKFAAGRDGLSEPLMSLGRPGQGMLLFVRFVRPGFLEIGVESMGNVTRMSPEQPYEPGRTYDLEFFCGSLLGGEDKVPSATLRYQLKNLVLVTFDGREVLNSFAPSHPATRDQIHAGVNLVEAGSAATAFSGEILAVRRGGYPAVQGEVLDTGRQSELGPVQVTARMPAHAAGVPEPIVVVGVPGDATMGFVRVLPGGRIKIGVEIWGVGAYESDPVPAPSNRDTELVFEFPALFPPAGDPRWSAVPFAEQEARRSRLTLKVNGRIALQRPVAAPAPRQAPVYFSENPVGGSFVTSAFTGQMQVSRLPLTGP